MSLAYFSGQKCCPFKEQTIVEIDWADALVGVGGSDDEKEHA